MASIHRQLRTLAAAGLPRTQQASHASHGAPYCARVRGHTLPQHRQRLRHRRIAALPPQAENPLLGLAELLGYTGKDTGHWNYSPEWYGTQDGGWGRDAGTAVFSAQSACGNGRVEVTAHPASLKGASTASACGSCADEWRVLRFNGTTRQSVARVTVAATEGGPSDVSITLQPDCLAFEYLKSVASVTAALLGLQRLLPDQDGPSSSGSSSSGTTGPGSALGSYNRDTVSPAQQPGQPALEQRLRVLCLGLGGGSLPMFLSHHFPFVEVDAVELDPVVVAAATQAMGLPSNQPRLRLHTADGLDFLQQRAQQAAQQQPLPYDLIFMDVFDGQDSVPAALCTPEFAQLLAAALHPGHGTLLLNLHSVNMRDIVGTFKHAILGGGSSYAAASSVSSRHANSPSGSPAGTGFSVSAQRQLNVCVVVARGLQLPASTDAARQRLKDVASYVAAQAGYNFPAGGRAARGYQVL